MDKKSWWAYKHANGTFYFVLCGKDYIVDMAEAEANPSIIQVYSPIEAPTIVEAQRKLKEKLKGIDIRRYGRGYGK